MHTGRPEKYSPNTSSFLGGRTGRGNGLVQVDGEKAGVQLGEWVLREASRDQRNGRVNGTGEAEPLGLPESRHPGHGRSIEAGACACTEARTGIIRVRFGRETDARHAAQTNRLQGRPHPHPVLVPTRPSCSCHQKGFPSQIFGVWRQGPRSSRQFIRIGINSASGPRRSTSANARCRPGASALSV